MANKLKNNMKKLIVLLILFFAKTSISAEIESQHETDNDILKEAPTIGFLPEDRNYSFNIVEEGGISIDIPDTQAPENVQKEIKEKAEQKLNREKQIIAAAAMAKPKNEDSQYTKEKKPKKRKEVAKRGTLFKPKDWQMLLNGRLKHKKCRSIIPFSAISKHTCPVKKREARKKKYDDKQWIALENGNQIHTICKREMAKTGRVGHEKLCDGITWILLSVGKSRHVPCNQEVNNNSKKRHLEECKVKHGE